MLLYVELLQLHGIECVQRNPMKKMEWKMTAYFKGDKRQSTTYQNLPGHGKTPTREVMSLPPASPAIDLISGKSVSQDGTLYFRTFPQLEDDFSHHLIYRPRRTRSHLEPKAGPSNKTICLRDLLSDVLL